MRLAQALLVLATLAGTGIAAAAPLPVGDTQQRLDLWPALEVLEDPAGTLAPAQAASAAERFTVPGGAIATLGMAHGVFWVRVPLDIRPGGEGDWILDVDYALLRHIDAYLAADGNVRLLAHVGAAQPVAQRPLPGRSHAVPLRFDHAGPAALLLRVDTPGARILPLTLARLPAFYAHAMGEQLLQGALACLGAFLALYSLVQWAALRQALFLKYALLVMASTLFSVHFFGLGGIYLWPDQAWLENHMAGIASLVAAAATALFVGDALARDLGPRIARTLQLLVVLHLGAAVAHGLDLLGIRTVGILMGTTGLLPGLLGLPGAVAMARRGDRVGPWFIVSWLGYFVASAVMVSVVQGRVGANGWTLHSFQIGATLDMLVFLRIALLRSAAIRLERQRLRQSFKGYVGPAVMEELLQGRLTPELGGEHRYVCVMFSDIRGYTTRSEVARPADMLAFLNRYLDGVVRIVHEHGGTVICFLGDGIMVVFGAPQTLADPCTAGYRAALALLDNLRTVNLALLAEGSAPMDIGIGLHAGEAVVGHIGSRQRHEYAAIGDVTNVAARLEGATKDAGFRLLVSDEVVRHLPGSPGLVALGPLALKGHSPVVAHGMEPVAARVRIPEAQEA